MAISRFSQVFTPHDYVKPFDLGMYATLINNRQGKFDTNVQTVNNELSQYTSLPLLKDSHKQYANQRVQEVSQQLNSLGAVDYSDSNVFRQTQSIVASVSKDPVILNALEWSNAVQTDNSIIEKSKKNKTYAVQNANPILQAQQEWLSNPDINAPYQSPGYQEFVEWDKPTVDKLKAMNANKEVITGETDAFGKPIVYNVSELTPSRVARAAINTMTEEQRNQVYIDAQFKHRGWGQPELVNELKSYKNEQLSQLTDAVTYADKMKIQLQNNKGTPEEIQQIEKYREDAVKQQELLKSQLASEPNLAKEALESQSFLKLNSYQRYIGEEYSNIFANKEVSVTGGGTGVGAGAKAKQDGNVIINADGSINYEASISIMTPDVNGSQSGLHNKSALVERSLEMENNIKQAKSSILEDYGKHDVDFGSKSQQEKEQTYAKWESDFYKNNTKDIPTKVLEHFANINEFSESKNLSDQYILKANSILQSDPEYVKASAGLKASEKMLKSSYKIQLGSRFGNISSNDGEKEYSKEEILEFKKALEMTGQKAGPSSFQIPFDISLISMSARAISNIGREDLDITKDIPVLNPSNRLIADVNNQIKKQREVNANYEKDHPFLKHVAASSMEIFNQRASVRDPLFNLAMNNQDVFKHLDNNETFSKVVNDLETKVYNELGFELLIPTTTLPMDNDTQNQFRASMNILHNEFAKEDNKMEVENIMGIKALLNNNLEIKYSLKNGTAAPISKTIELPRTAAPSYSKLVPEDSERILQETIRINGATTGDITKALRFTVGHESIPYRIISNSDKTLQVQFFDDNGKPIINFDSRKFTDVHQLKMVSQQIAASMITEKLKKEQTNK